MKILYAIQGTGNGHASRAIEIVPLLQKRAEVDVLISGYQCELRFPFEIKYNLYGLSFVFGKKGGIDFWQTLRKTKLKKLFKEIGTLPVQEYDLVINDFEPISAWACKLKNIPIVSLCNQNAISDENIPKYGKLRIERLILKHYAPAKHKFGFHYKTYSSSTFLPIIRQEIRNQIPTDNKHYTVYLPAYSDEKIVTILSHFENIHWEVFSKHTNEFQLHKNISIFPINQHLFVKSMASSRGVICGAGFETPSEALFLKKKLLVIPMKQQFEQQNNALVLKEMGVAVLKKFNKKQLSKIEKWLETTNVVEVNYPNVTEDILDAIILPFQKAITDTNLPLNRL